MMNGRKPTRAYWNAYGALYGKQEALAVDNEPPKVDKKKSKVDKPKPPTEVYEQIKSAIWLERNNIPFYHIPNGGSRNMIEAVKLKRMGTKAGVPDICIVLARKGYHGLYIELKRVKGGSLSDSQKVWRDILIKEGYLWHEAKGADDLIQFVQNYIGC